jgi:hypothetical protein
VTVVEIGAVDVSLDVINTYPDEIDVAIPSGNAGGDITLTSPEGTSSGTFTVVEHSNGLGGDYYDDQATGTFLATEAQAAAAVWGGSSASVVQCTGEDALQATDGTNWATWVYGTGSLQGYVVVAATPTCPTTSDSPWN